MDPGVRRRGHLGGPLGVGPARDEDARERPHGDHALVGLLH